MEPRTRAVASLRRAWRTSRCDGFTIIELMVVIGIITILIGLMTPTIAGARHSAKLTRWTATIRQNGVLIRMYTDASREVFPIANTNAHWNMNDWYRALIDAGLAQSARDFDPNDHKPGWTPNYLMNRALCDAWSDMQPGLTEPVEATVSDPVREPEVLFPDRLGIMVRYTLPDPEHGHGWCCARPVTGPVLFGDHSAALAEWTDFVEASELVLENYVGGPCMTTWYGARGRDR